MKEAYYKINFYSTKILKMKIFEKKYPNRIGWLEGEPIK